jgi:hypothetical protein
MLHGADGGRMTTAVTSVSGAQTMMHDLLFRPRVARLQGCVLAGAFALSVLGGLTSCGDDALDVTDDAACEDTECVAPPAAECVGDVLLEYEPTGTCDAAGECSYDTMPTDCARLGGTCVRGVCSGTGEPCGGVACETPPGATCDGDVAVRYSPAGVCERNECEYPTVLTDCTETDETCLNGSCVEQPGFCTDVTCDVPPAVVCQGATSRVTWRTPGTCDAATGECSYTQSIEACNEGEVCRDGICYSTSDLCAGQTCEEPPAAVCAGDMARTVFQSPGTCDTAAGECDYVAVEEPCASGDVCIDGECVVDPGPCGGPCDDPPAASCSDEDTVVSAAEVGTCNPVSGSCEYATAPTPCGAGRGCLLGRCVDDIDPCLEVVCDEPPVTSCANERQTLSYAADGTCNSTSGLCTYATSVSDCPADRACRAGACVDLCEGIVCPVRASTCAENTVVSYSGAGTCVSATGACDYATVEVRTACASDELCRLGVCERQVQPGEVVVSEFMANPITDESEEWFELQNVSGDTLSLDGMVIRDLGRDSFTVPAGISLPPGGRAVFAKTADVIPGAVHVYGSGFNLSNSDDAIQIYAGDVLIEDLRYDVGLASAGWPRTEGRSVSLSREFVAVGEDNGIAARWCSGEGVYDGTNQGTPGAENGLCDLRCVGVTCRTSAAFCAETNIAVSFIGPGTCNPATGSCDDSTVEVRTTCPESQECYSGACVRAGVLIEPGDLVITEYMSNPSGTDAGKEWFEVQNVSGRDLYLGGLNVFDSAAASGAAGETFVVSEDPLLADGQFIVFEQVAGAAGATPATTWDWGGTTAFELTNTTDSVVLSWRDVEIDRIAWSSASPTWPAREGYSVQLNRGDTIVDNTAVANWCVTPSAVYDTVNRGTPGVQNPACEAPTDLTAYEPGSLVITEIMRDPDSIMDANGEWFEIYNASGITLNLNGLRFMDDGSNAFTVGRSIVLGPGEYAVFANTSGALGTGSSPTFVFSAASMALGNSADELIIMAGTVEVDRVEWTGAFPSVAGRAMSLKPAFTTFTGNDSSSNWCDAGTRFATGDYGTPGAANPTESTCRR